MGELVMMFSGGTTSCECIATSGKMAESVVQAVFGDKKFVSERNPVFASAKSQEIVNERS